MLPETRRFVDAAGVGKMQTQASNHVNHLLTETEACEYLRVRPRQLFNWRMSGLVPFIRIGRAIRFRVSDLDAAVDRMTINPIQPTAAEVQTSNPADGHEDVV
jgi:excisionase family DNA binding protein